MSKSNSVDIQYELRYIYKTHKKFPDNVLNYWLYYFNFAYFTLSSPFRIKFNREQNQFYLSSSFFTKILNGLTFFLILLNIRYTSNFLTQQGDIFSLYFEVSKFLASTLLSITIRIILYFRSSKVIKIIELVRGAQFYYVMPKIQKNYIEVIKTKAKFFYPFALVITSYFGFTFISIFNFIFFSTSDFLQTLPPQNVVENFWRFLYIDAIFPLLSILIYVAGGFSVLALVLSDLLIFTTSLILNHLLDNFKETWKYCTPQEVFDEYKKFRALVLEINGFVSPAVFLLAFATVPWYSWGLLALSEARDFLSFFMLLSSISISLNTLLTGARVSQKSHLIKEWLCENERHLEIDERELYLILNDASSGGGVGLSGLGFFTLSYRQMASLMGSIVSVFVIVLQFKINPSTGNTVENNSTLYGNFSSI